VPVVKLQSENITYVHSPCVHSSQVSLCCLVIVFATYLISYLATNGPLLPINIIRLCLFVDYSLMRAYHYSNLRTYIILVISNIIMNASFSLNA